MFFFFNAVSYTFPWTLLQNVSVGFQRVFLVIASILNHTLQPTSYSTTKLSSVSQLLTVFLGYSIISALGPQSSSALRPGLTPGPWFGPQLPVKMPSAILSKYTLYNSVDPKEYKSLWPMFPPLQVNSQAESRPPWESSQVRGVFQSSP